jgi:hypothetical protein
MSMRRSVLALLALAFSCLLPAAANAACPTDSGSAATTDLTIVRDALKEICAGTVPGNSGTPTDKGGTITVGGTAQTAIASNASRKRAVCENPVSATENLFISITTSATTTGANDYADLAPGGSATIYGTSAVSLNAATTAHRFLCTEWQ